MENTPFATGENSQTPDSEISHIVFLNTSQENTMQDLEQHAVTLASSEVLDLNAISVGHQGNSQATSANDQVKVIQPEGESLMTAFQTGLEKTLSLVQNMTVEQRSQALSALEQFLGHNRTVLVDPSGAGDASTSSSHTAILHTGDSSEQIPLPVDQDSSDKTHDYGTVEYCIVNQPSGVDSANQVEEEQNTDTGTLSQANADMPQSYQELAIGIESSEECKNASGLNTETGISHEQSSQETLLQSSDGPTSVEKAQFIDPQGVQTLSQTTYNTRLKDTETSESFSQQVSNTNSEEKNENLSVVERRLQIFPPAEKRPLKTYQRGPRKIKQEPREDLPMIREHLNITKPNLSEEAASKTTGTSTPLHKVVVKKENDVKERKSDSQVVRRTYGTRSTSRRQSSASTSSNSGMQRQDRSEQSRERMKDFISSGRGGVGRNRVTHKEKTFVQRAEQSLEIVKSEQEMDLYERHSIPEPVEEEVTIITEESEMSAEYEEVHEIFSIPMSTRVKRGTKVAIDPRHVTMVPEGSKWKCSVCNKIMRYKHNMTVHLRHHTHQHPYVCQYCTTGFTTISNLRRHMRTRHPGKEFKPINKNKEVWKCAQCEMVFNKREHMKLHLDTVHRVHAKKKEPFICPVCDKVFNRPDRLKAHVAIHKGDRPFVCPKCPAKFTFKPNLIRHMKVHADDRKHMCTDCDAGFIEKRSLMKHRVKVHKDPTVVIKVEEHPCDICGKRFTAKHNMLIHKQNTHEGKKPYTCCVCGRNFSLRSNMLRHEQTHSGQRNHSCPICKKLFSEKKSVTIHMRQHTGERPYKCNVCGKQFSQPGTLQTHMPVHHRQRNFLCGLCGKTFLRRSHFRFHMDKHSNPPKFGCEQCPAKFYRRSDLNRHSLKHTHEKPFKCDVCGKPFTRQHYLKEHMNLHSGARPYKCKSCDFTASDSSTLYKHKLLHNAAPRKLPLAPIIRESSTHDPNGASMIVKLLTGQLSGAQQQEVKQELSGTESENILIQSGNQLIPLSEFGCQPVQLNTDAGNQLVHQLPDQVTSQVTSHMIQVPGQVTPSPAIQIEENKLQNQMAIDSIMALANMVSVQEESSSSAQHEIAQLQNNVDHIEQITVPVESTSHQIQEQSAEEQAAEEASRLSFKEAVDEIVATVLVDEPEVQQLPAGSITEIQVPLMTSDGSQGEYLLILQPNENDG